MPNGEAGEKTEKATPYRRRKAREEGNVSKSIDVNTSFVMLSFLLISYFTGGYLGGNVYGFFTQTFENLNDFNHNFLLDALYVYLKIFFFVAIPLMFAGVVANVAQFGFIFTLKPLTPNFNKLNPVEGIKKLFSLRTVFELLKGLLKILAVGIVIYLIVKGDFAKFISSIYSPPDATLFFILKEILKLLLYAVLMYIIISILDFSYQKWDYEKKLMMTKQEVKEEYKQREGRPEVKAAIRKRQREIAMRRMMQEVPKADVVITNPTHYAVALKYDPEEREAPFVVAKGADEIAKKIIEVAKENNVPVVQRPEIAREIYKICDIDEEIPEELYKAVAEILAFVYKLKNKMLLH
jgi:flagellar biosynthetic protein FlhB